MNKLTYEERSLAAEGEVLHADDAESSMGVDNSKLRRSDSKPQASTSSAFAV